MWGRKKSDRPAAAQPEAQNLEPIRVPKPVPPTCEGTTQSGRKANDLTSATADRATTRLGTSLQVKGEIVGSEDLHIDGTIEGLIQLGDGKLTVGATANVTAEIFAREVVVYGSVKGNVRAKDQIVIKKEGSVTGDLSMAQIVIEDGAYFKGSIEIIKSAERQAEKNPYPPAA
jgi:cytoskeletal protein CcmA (bactofilin family)